MKLFTCRDMVELTTPVAPSYENRGQAYSEPPGSLKTIKSLHGAIYSISAAKGLTGLFAHKTPIKGLYLSGQTTYPGLGIPTAALSGIQARKS